MRPKLTFLAAIPENMLGTKKHSTSLKEHHPHCEVWHCFSSDRTGALIWVQGIMISSEYQSILAQNLTISAKKLNMKGNFIFQDQGFGMAEAEPRSKSNTAGRVEEEAWQNISKSGCAKLMDPHSKRSK